MKRARSAATAVAAVLPAALLAGACNSWAMFGFDGTHSGYNPIETVIKAENVRSLVEGEYSAVPNPNPGSVIRSSPTLYGGIVYETANVGATDAGTLYAYSADASQNCSGAGVPYSCGPVWSVTPSGDHGLNTSPTVDESRNVVYVGSDDGILYAYNASTGAPLWQSGELGGEINGSLTIADGSVYVSMVYGWTYAFPLTNGTDGVNPSCHIRNRDGARVCNAQWGASTPGDVESSPAVAQIGQNWYLYTTSALPAEGTYGGYLYAYSAAYSPGNCPGIEWGDASEVATCTPMWAADWDPAMSSPAVSTANDKLYIDAGDEGLWALSADGSAGCAGTPFKDMMCSPLWRADLPGLGSAASPSVLPPGSRHPDGIVYLGNRSGNLYAVDGQNGSVLWTAATGGVIDSAAAIADKVVYVGCSNKLEASGQVCGANLFAFNVLTGRLLWTASTGGPTATIDHSPIIADTEPAASRGAVFVGSSSGVLGGTGTGCFNTRSPSQCTGQVFAFTLPPS